ncbi:MAG TPA: carbohydrate binding domain-containing protein [Candidatus Saccharimonadales bacterium]
MKQQKIETKMQGKQSLEGVQRIGGLSVVSDGLSSVQSTTPANASPAVPSPAAPSPKPAKRSRVLPAWLWLSALAILVLIVGASIFFLRTNTPTELKAENVPITSLPLGDLASNTPANTTENLQINGQLQVSDSLLLAPRLQPSNPLLGELYFDTNSNRLAYYNGQEFIQVGGSTTNISNATNTTVASTAITNVTNQTESGVELQAAAPGTPQTGNFNISGTGTVGTLTANTVQGSGSGTFSVVTPQSSNISNAMLIKTGDSSTTAAGNLTIDTGSSVIDGDIITHKTFETGMDNMLSWFTTNITRSTAQAHTGSYSLAETGTAPNWGVIELLPGTNVIPGHQYYFSIWVRADTVPRTITASAAWVGAGNPVPLNSITDSTSEWREMTGLATAPAGATSVYFRIQGLAATGETHYFDDITITDLSSSTNIATLNVGANNAKKITIGNLTQIGSTSIFGGSGINLNSGAATTTINAGSLNAIAGANSSIQTSGGALTLTSAETATWGVATAVSGTGGDLTLKAGNGSTSGTNNGGSLILQGGNANAGGTSGQVIVRPQADSTTIFQIQNSASTPLFMADSTNMRLTVTGTNTVFSTLILNDSHFRSTQTTAPAIATPANCGSAPSAVITSGSTDSAGSLTITTGTGGSSTSCDTTVTFQRPYAAAPKSILVVGKTDAASAARQPYIVSETASSFTMSFANSAGGANATSYQFSYWVIE